MRNIFGIFFEIISDTLGLFFVVGLVSLIVFFLGEIGFLWGIILFAVGCILFYYKFILKHESTKYLEESGEDKERLLSKFREKVKPIDGHVCIFPGWLNHYVEPTSDNTKRIIVSCNVYSRKQVQ